MFPTLLGLLGVDPRTVLGTRNVGIDVARGVDPLRVRVGCEPSGCHTLPADVAGLMATRRAYAAYVDPARSGWDAVVEDGGDPAVLGHPVRGGEETADSWELVEPRELPRPPLSLAVVRVSVTGARPADGSTIIAFDGIAAGWLGASGVTSAGRTELLGIVDWRRYHGRHTRIDLYHVGATATTRYQSRSGV